MPLEGVRSVNSVIALLDESKVSVLQRLRQDLKKRFNRGIAGHHSVGHNHLDFSSHCQLDD